MATITLDRCFPYQSGQASASPPVLSFPIAASMDFIVPGDFFDWASGQVTGDNTVIDSDPTIGTIEIAVGSTALAADTLVPITIALPNFIWEGSMDDTDAYATADNGVSRPIKDSSVAISTTGHVLGGLIDGTSTTAPVAKVIGAVGSMTSFVVGSFIDKAAATVTAGSTVRPNSSKGIIGDTDVRVMFMWDIAGCLLVA